MDTRKRTFSGRTKLVAALLALGSVGTVAIVTDSIGSDHLDTAEVEFHPRRDINDVYAFPSPNDPHRIVLVMTTSSPLTPGRGNASFDPNLLYQIKVDNTGDAVEDLVLQFHFSHNRDDQGVHLRGPVAPEQTGTRNTMVDIPNTLAGRINTVLGSADGIQLFAGLRDDPFYLDFEQFVKILPDRGPETGPLSRIGPEPEASAFRGGPTPPFEPGDAVDFFAGFNGLAIVVELPMSMLLGASEHDPDPKLGIWTTTSK